MVLKIFILSEARDYLDNLFYFYFFFKFPLQDVAQGHFGMSSCTLGTPENSHIVHFQ